MRWLARAVGWLVRRATGVKRKEGAQRREAEESPTADETRDKILKGIGAGRAFRQRNIHVVGGTVSQDNVAWDEEHMEFMENKVQNVVNYRLLRTCSCGSLFGYGSATLLGLCQVKGCGRTVCSQQGCGGRCERCGALCCRRHTVRYTVKADEKVKEHIFCFDCRWKARWKWFFGVLR
jgi:hypothetical protein